MRKTITAAVAATILGMGVTSVHASASPYAAAVLATPYVVSNIADSDPEVGAELAGLANANTIGTGAANLQSTINTTVTNIVSRETAAGGTYYGDEAYGIAYANLVAPSAQTAAGAAAVSAFYATIPSTPISIASHDGTGYATTDNFGLFELSYSVLATNLLGSSTTSTYVSGLASALGGYSVSNNSTYGASGEPDTAEPLYQGTTEDLALAVYALAKAGFASTTAGTLSADHPFAGQSLSDLKATLIGDLNAELAGTQYTQDLTYGVLALDALGDTADATTYLNALVALVGTSTPGPVPNSTLYTRANVEDAGVALQALPEPATLSLIGFGGMALLARRRRMA